MMVDDVLARKREVLALRRAELERQERGEGDRFKLFLLEEELHDLNARLRALRGAPRARGMANSALAMDCAQYRSWLAEERDEETREARRVYIDALKSGVDTLTARQRELFELWQDGAGVSELARRFGVDKSTVSRTLARCKTHLREEAARLARERRLEGMTVFDLADREVAKVILSCLTSNQAVCVYLYYGEWLNLRDCGELLGVGHTAVLRTVQRGLRAIQETLRCGTFTLDNVDALSELAYELYLEQNVPETLLAPRARGAWGRKKLGYRAKKQHYRAPVRCTVRTSDGLVSRSGEAHCSLSRPMSRLLTLLYELRARGALYRWLSRLFGGITKRREAEA